MRQTRDLSFDYMYPDAVTSVTLVMCARASCRTCGRVVCDDCSAKRLKSERTCAACWDRLGRKMSGLGLAQEDDAAAAAAAAANGGVRKSALVEFLEVGRAVLAFRCDA